jgi:hypothetical protein
MLALVFMGIAGIVISKTRDCKVYCIVFYAFSLFFIGFIPLVIEGSGLIALSYIEPE